MANEDFTTYDEIADPDSDLTITSSKITVVDNDEDDGGTYRGDDKDAGHFDGDFTHLVEVYPDDTSEGDSALIYWTVGQGGGGYWSEKSGDMITCFVYKGGANCTFYCDAYNNGSRIGRDSGNLTWDTLYYVTVDRDDDGGGSSVGRMTITIRTGSHTGTIQDTLDVDLNEQVDYRYIYGYSNAASGNTGRAVYGYVQNLDIQEAAAAGNPWSAYAQQ